MKHWSHNQISYKDKQYIRKDRKPNYHYYTKCMSPVTGISSRYFS